MKILGIALHGGSVKKFWKNEEMAAGRRWVQARESDEGAAKRWKG